MIGQEDFQEATKEEYIRAEMLAKVRPVLDEDSAVTESFTSKCVSGKTEKL